MLSHIIAGFFSPADVCIRGECVVWCDCDCNYRVGEKHSHYRPAACISSALLLNRSLGDRRQLSQLGGRGRAELQPPNSTCASHTPSQELRCALRAHPWIRLRGSRPAQHTSALSDRYKQYVCVLGLMILNEVILIKWNKRCWVMPVRRLISVAGIRGIADT